MMGVAMAPSTRPPTAGLTHGGMRVRSEYSRTPRMTRTKIAAIPQTTMAISA